jgi:hypothetical protein
MRKVLCGWVVLWSSLLFAADPVVTGPTTIEQGTVGVFKVAPGGKFLPNPTPGLDVKASEAGTELFVTGDPNKYTLSGNYFTVDFEKKTWDVKQVLLPVQVTPKAGPTPGPTPTPDPDNPDDPNPFETRGGADDGLRVLVVYDDANKHKMPVPQFLVLQGAKFRDYVENKCAPDGYRIFPSNIQVPPNAQAEWWSKPVAAKAWKSLPWMYAGKGRHGYNGKLPADTDSTIKVLNKVSAK